jgi:hypothetical protein
VDQGGHCVAMQEPPSVGEKDHGETSPAVRAPAVGDRGVEACDGGKHPGGGMTQPGQEEECHCRGAGATQRRHQRDRSGGLPGPSKYPCAYYKLCQGGICGLSVSGGTLRNLPKIWGAAWACRLKLYHPWRSGMGAFPQHETDPQGVDFAGICLNNMWHVAHRRPVGRRASPVSACERHRGWRPGGIGALECRAHHRRRRDRSGIGTPAANSSLSVNGAAV